MQNYGLPVARGCPRSGRVTQPGQGPPVPDPSLARANLVGICLAAESRARPILPTVPPGVLVYSFYEKTDKYALKMGPEPMAIYKSDAFFKLITNPVPTGESVCRAK